MLTFRSSPLNVNLQRGEGRVGRDGFCCGGMDNPLSLSALARRGQFFSLSLANEGHWHCSGIQLLVTCYTMKCIILLTAGY